MRKDATFFISQVPFLVEKGQKDNFKVFFSNPQKPKTSIIINILSQKISFVIFSYGQIIQSLHLFLIWCRKLREPKSSQDFVKVRNCITLLMVVYSKHIVAFKTNNFDQNKKFIFIQHTIQRWCCFYLL